MSHRAPPRREQRPVSLPEEQRVEAKPSIAGPVLRSLKWIEEGNVLADLYVELLKRAVDKDRMSEAHPAFVGIIDQLSPEEARFLLILRDADGGDAIRFVRVSIINEAAEQEQVGFVMLGDEAHHDHLDSPLPDDVEDCARRLVTLGLVVWGHSTDLVERRGVSIVRDVPETLILREAERIRGLYRNEQWKPTAAPALHFTGFGTRFVRACVPVGLRAADAEARINLVSDAPPVEQ